MNVLILTGKFGMGHYSAALALEEQIKTMDSNSNIKVVDFINFMVSKADNIVYDTFNFMVGKCPSLYNTLNVISSRNNSAPLTKVMLKRISKLLVNVDVIVSTLPICSQYISAYKQMEQSQIPLYTYITDIMIHEEWISENTNMYFVGDNLTKEQLVSKGIDKEKIKITGIPVKKGFNGEIKKVNKKKKILIMGGGLGLIPEIDNLITDLTSYGNIDITIIAGKNNKLMNELRNKFSRIKVIGYTDKVSYYMNKADLIITKAGGITVFEAIHSRTPLYIIKPFLSQEIGNAKFVEKKHIGKIIWNKNEDMVKEIMEILNNKEELEKMKSNMKEINDNLEEYSIFDAITERSKFKC